MKNILKYIGIAVLICFSFFYSDKVEETLKESDSIMISIKQNKDSKNTDAINATINGNYITPGINGKKININKSYSKMKNIGTYSEEYLIYDQIKPKISIYDNYNLYIKTGNKIKNTIAIIFIVNNLNLINQLDLLNEKLNVFINYDFLIENSKYIKKTQNIYFYNYGDTGEYSYDNLIFANNLIKRIKNEANICLTKTENQKVLNICSENELFTIIPNIQLNKNIYTQIQKENIQSTDIVLIDEFNDINQIKLVINYLHGKGYELEYLSEIVSENT